VVSIIRKGLVLTGVGVVLAVSSGPALADTSVVEARLQEQNNSGAGGTASLTATEDGRLTVKIQAEGLVPGQPHAQHIHGTAGGAHFMCPSLENDKDGDGYLSNEEATGEYGTIFLSLTTSGDASADSGLALDRMPVADSSGNLDYERTFDADDVPADLLANLAEVHVVQHGIDVNDNDSYDLDGLGESTFAKNLGAPGVPEEATNPATCGVVIGAGSAQPPLGGPETGGGTTGTGTPAPAVWGLLLLGASGALIAVRGLRRKSPSES
jgi:hypothetical protein